MLVFEELLEKFKNEENLVKVGVDDKFNFTIKDQIFVIESGSVKGYGAQNPKTGLKEAQNFEEHDPIGFAEAMSSREHTLKFRQLSDITLIKFNGANLRQQINDSDIFAKTIIKYSLGRIFGLKKGNNFSFEDSLLDSKEKIFNRLRFPKDSTIYNAGSSSKHMYFIEKGSVQIVSSEKKVLATLDVGECFGEAAILKDRNRNYTVTAKVDCSLLAIEKSVVEQKMSNNSPLVQLSVIMLLKRLELMNTFK